MEKTCPLCLQKKHLESSHLIPKFIFKWIKDSGTGFMRSSENFNRRVQDGFKEPFLCGSCEDIFSKDETYFANKVFYPTVELDLAIIQYNNQLHRFVISVFWRLLKHSILEEEKHRSFYPALAALEQSWKTYLLDPGGDISDEGLHVLSGVDVAEAVGDDPVSIPSMMIQYMARMVDAGITDSPTKCMFFLKIPRFLFIYQIYGFEKADFSGTMIFPAGGTLDRNAGAITDTDIGDFFLDRVRMIEEMFKNMSDSQKEKIRNFSVENWQSVKIKDLGTILRYKENKN
jgi:hypothetical protein